jgi:hypothetical protein
MMAFDFGMLSIALAAAIVAPAAAPQETAPAMLPFGISQDMRPSTLGCEAIDGGGSSTSDATGQYVCKGAPEASDLFSEYILAYVKGTGICNISAVSSYIAEDSDGKKTRALFGKAYALMSQQLGKPDETVDHATSNEFRDNRQFEEAIISEDRQIFDQWNDLSLRFGNAESASLTISGSDELGLAVYGIFRFAGNDDCLRKMELATGRSAGE